MVTVICQWCKSEFEAQRTSAKFCSDSCKTANHRYNPAAIMAEHSSNAYYQIKNMLKVLERSPELAPEVYEKLIVLGNEIDDFKRNIYQAVVAEENKRLL